MEIINYPNYLIYDDGKVWSKIGKGKWLKPRLSGPKKNNYFTVGLINSQGRKSFKIHRLIAEYYISNSENKSMVDHIDGNRFNNIKNNLRWATRSENCQNSKKHKNNTSGFKGVSFDKLNNKFMSSIYHNGKSIHLGRYTSAEEASVVYELKARELFGIYYRDTI